MSIFLNDLDSSIISQYPEIEERASSVSIIEQYVRKNACDALSDEEFFSIYNREKKNFENIHQYERIIQSKISSLSLEYRSSYKSKESKELATEYIKKYDPDYKVLLDLYEKVKPVCSLIERSYYRMVLKIANKYASAGASLNRLNEFISDGLLGLHRALLVYDSESDNKFSSVAYKYIDTEIRNNLYMKNFSIINTRSQYQISLKARDLYYKYRVEMNLSYDETINRIVKDLDGNIGKANLVNLLFSTGACKYFDDTNTEDECPDNYVVNIDLVTSNDDFANETISMLDEKNTIEYATDILKSLVSEKLYETFIKYIGLYGEPMKYTELSREYGVKPQAIELRIKRVKKVINDNIELFEKIRPQR